jgi:hypothetical protein
VSKAEHSTINQRLDNSEISPPGAETNAPQQDLHSQPSVITVDDINLPSLTQLTHFVLQMHPQVI